MLRINYNKKPQWIEFKPFGVRVLVRPCTNIIYKTALAIATNQVKDLTLEYHECKKSGLPVDGFPAMDTDEQRNGLTNALFESALFESAFIRYEELQVDDSNGAMDETETTEIECNINDLMLIPDFAQQFMSEYTPAVEVLRSEGEPSGNGLNGSTKVEANIAEGAENKGCPVQTDSQEMKESGAHLANTDPEPEKDAVSQS